MDAEVRCRGCGNALASVALNGLCPVCLLLAGLNADSVPQHEVSVLLGPASSGVLSSLAESLGGIPRVLLRDTDADTGPGPVVQPGSSEMPGAADRSGRLQFLGEIARGGMGAVLKGRDPDLGRDLAVKVLLEAHRDRPEFVRRFIEEAQIAGQLQHPGIVPVYELGAFADRRPYFAMKLVKGRTLAALLAHHKAPAGDLAQLLGIFEQVAQTVAYAHARGVIHRDLKPSNIMVGSFGEVQVMDWGLAKVLPRGGVADDASAGKTDDRQTVIATARSLSDADLSQAGSVLGTPSYMAPEQARGEVDQVDERADVFALGSILCEILTGQPAFAGRSCGEIQRKAARGELADALARLDQCGADGELVVLAKTCLASERDDRPRNASKVAERVSAFRSNVQERLRKAELDRAVAKAEAAAERRRQKVKAALVVSILGTVLLAAGGGFWVQQDRSLRAIRRVDIERQAREVLQDALVWQKDGQLESAKAALAKADGLLMGEVGDELRQLAAQRRSDLNFIASVEQIRLQQFEAIPDKKSRARTVTLSQNQPAAGPRYAEAFRQYGIDVLHLDGADVARQIRERELCATLVAALDHWRLATTSPEEKERLLRIARAAEPDPAGLHSQVREALVAKDKESVRELTSKIITEIEPFKPSGICEFAKELPDEDAIRVLLAGQQHFPADFWINLDLAMRLKGMGPLHRGEAIRYMGVCHSLRPKDWIVGNNLGILLLRDNRLEEAERVFGTCTRLDPQQADSWFNLGQVLSLQERVEGAINALSTAIVVQPGHNLAEDLFFNLLEKDGALLSKFDQLKQALPPDDRSYLHYLEGRSLAVRKKLPEAVQEFQEALALNPRAHLAYFHLGRALLGLGKHADALEAMQKARNLDPNDPDMLKGIGFALAMAGEWQQAGTYFREVIALNLSPQSDTFSQMAVCLMQQDQPDIAGAEKHLQKALELNRDNAQASQNLGVIRMRQGRWAEAETLLRNSIRLNPWEANFHCDLGTVLGILGRFREAIAPLRQAVKLVPNFADAHHELGKAQVAVGEYSDGFASLKRAATLLPSDDKRQGSLVEEMRHCESQIALVDKLPAVLKKLTQPADAREAVRFADVCMRRGLHASATNLFAQGLAQKPELAQGGAHLVPARSAALAGIGYGQDAFLFDDANRAQFRMLSLGWLRKALAAWGKEIEDGKDTETTRGMLAAWKSDPDLAGVRDPDRLARLPAAEREEWRVLWIEVENLLKKAQKKAK